MDVRRAATRKHRGQLIQRDFAAAFANGRRIGRTPGHRPRAERFAACGPRFGKARHILERSLDTVQARRARADRVGGKVCAREIAARQRCRFHQAGQGQFRRPGSLYSQGFGSVALGQIGRHRKTLQNVGRESIGDGRRSCRGKGSVRCPRLCLHCLPSRRATRGSWAIGHAHDRCHRSRHGDGCSQPHACGSAGWSAPCRPPRCGR